MSDTAVERIQHQLSILCMGATEEVRAQLCDLIKDVDNLEVLSHPAGLPSPDADDAKRLDWLSHRMGEASVALWDQLGLSERIITLRDAIDDAMEKERR